MKKQLFLAVALLYLFCQRLFAHPPLQVGDLIFRMGTVTDSRLIAGLSHSQFSHIGVVVKTSPEVWIIHASSEGEPRQDKVFLHSFAEFSQPKNAEYIAVARPHYLNETEKNEIAESLIKSQDQPFILRPKNEPHRYCSTLIFDEIKRLKPEFDLHWQPMNIPLLRGEYLFPQAFIDHQDFEWIITPPRAQ